MVVRGRLATMPSMTGCMLCQLQSVGSEASRRRLESVIPLKLHRIGRIFIMVSVERKTSVNVNATPQFLAPF